jgi:hypothetical protein
VHNQMLQRQEKARWKDLLQLTEQLGCHFFPTPQPLSEISPWHKASERKISTLLAPSRHAQGCSLEPSTEEATQSICGSHDSSSLRPGQSLGSLPSLDSLHTHPGNFNACNHSITFVLCFFSKT